MSANDAATVSKPASSTNGTPRTEKWIFGVHRRIGDFHGEIELVELSLDKAEAYAKWVSAECWDTVVVSGRIVGKAGQVTDLSRWERGLRLAEINGPRTRKVDSLPRI